MKNKSLTQINANLTQINADKSATICVSRMQLFCEVLLRDPDEILKKLQHSGQSARICVQEKIFKIFVQIILLLLTYLLLINSSFAQEEKFFEIRAKQFSYTPNIIKVNKNDKVRIRLISEDVTHGLFIDGYGIETSAHPGQDGSLTFIADKTGRFSFRCSVTCGEFHPYMIGYLIVEPNSRFLTYILLTILIGLGSILFSILKKRAVKTQTQNG